MNNTNNTVSGGTSPTETPANAGNVPTATEFTVKVSGAVATTTQAMPGEKLSDVLARAGIDGPLNYNYRQGNKPFSAKGNKPFSATREIIGNIELIAVAKAGGG